MSKLVTDAYWTCEVTDEGESDPLFLFRKYPDGTIVNVYDPHSMTEVDVFTLPEPDIDFETFRSYCLQHVDYLRETEEETQRMIEQSRDFLEAGKIIAELERDAER